ncbi:hypothetical protein K439DRAFT_1642235, partial [Ramaria rubella]
IFVVRRVRILLASALLTAFLIGFWNEIPTAHGGMLFLTPSLVLGLKLHHREHSSISLCQAKGQYRTSVLA